MHFTGKFLYSPFLFFLLSDFYKSKVKISIILVLNDICLLIFRLLKIFSRINIVIILVLYDYYYFIVIMTVSISIFY